VDSVEPAVGLRVGSIVAASGSRSLGADALGHDAAVGFRELVHHGGNLVEGEDANRRRPIIREVEAR